MRRRTDRRNVAGLQQAQCGTHIGHSRGTGRRRDLTRLPVGMRQSTRRMKVKRVSEVALQTPLCAARLQQVVLADDERAQAGALVQPDRGLEGDLGTDAVGVANGDADSPYPLRAHSGIASRVSMRWLSHTTSRRAIRSALSTRVTSSM